MFIVLLMGLRPLGGRKELSFILSEQIRMGTCIYKVENLQPLPNTVDEQPVGLDVALSATLVLPGERVVAVHSVQFVAISERPHNTVELVHRQATLLRPLVGVREFDTILHPSMLFR